MNNETSIIHFFECPKCKNIYRKIPVSIIKDDYRRCICRNCNYDGLFKNYTDFENPIRLYDNKDIPEKFDNIDKYSKIKFRYVFQGTENGSKVRYKIFTLEELNLKKHSGLIGSMKDGYNVLLSVDRDTGLKDKNNNDIYERDICKHDQEVDFFEIIYKNGGFGYIYMHTFHSFAGHNHLDYLLENFEIVKNDYEFAHL